MKMKKLLFACLSVLFLISTANAGILPFGVYTGIRGGIGIAKKESNILDDAKIETNNSPFVSINAGIRLSDIRIEAEYLYKNSLKEIKIGNSSKNISPTSTLANVYYNFIDIPFVKLYVNGGLGYTDLRTNYVEDDKKFTYSLGLGATFTLLDIIAIDAGYRHINMGKEEIAGYKHNFYTNDLYVGLRFGF